MKVGVVSDTHNNLKNCKTEGLMKVGVVSDTHNNLKNCKAPAAGPVMRAL